MLCKKIELMMLKVGSLVECLRTAFMLLKDIVGILQALLALLVEYPGTGLQAHTHTSKHSRSWDSFNYATEASCWIPTVLPWKLAWKPKEGPLKTTAPL